MQYVVLRIHFLQRSGHGNSMTLRQIVEQAKALVKTTLRSASVRWHVKRGLPVPFRHDGATYYMNPDSSAEYHIANSIQKLQRLVSMVSTPPNVVFDVGGHCGIFSALTEKAWPTARIYCFEPSLDVLAVAKANCGTAVTLCPYALAERDKTASLYVNPGAQQTNSLDRQAASVFLGTGTLIERMIQCRSIDSFASENAIRKIDVLKIDVQGSEGDVLRGATAMLPTVDLLLIESTWMDISSITQLIPFALESGLVHACVVNPVYLGADLALSRTPIPAENTGLVLLKFVITADLLAQRWC